MNGTQSMLSCFNPAARRIGETFAYCVLFVVSLVGNTLIGFIVYKTKTLQKPINFFIVNMAMSDLLFPIFLFPRELVSSHSDSFPWLIGGTLGEVLCKLVPFAIDISTSVSILSLVLIAVDRFEAVVFPLRFLLISSKQCRFFVLATWIIAMAVHCPHLLVLKVVEHQKKLLCVIQLDGVFGDYLSHLNYMTALSVAFFYVPLALISVLYTAIALKIKLQKTPGEQTASGRDQRLKRERHVIKMSVAIVLVFAVCSLPRGIWWFLRRFSSDRTMLSCFVPLTSPAANVFSKDIAAFHKCQ
ncbi:neuropeptide SIFamide receptor-like [Stylophora pistillata]|uniref:neuropeptide SIFamide receptor-like n=1 Tax=Stylophora pistillata TaxID=50429 RepID=UPI000C03947B|nr:neuropeptide SIFamide receptor-like [Stylophora pistillata]